MAASRITARVLHALPANGYKLNGKYTVKELMLIKSSIKRLCKMYFVALYPRCKLIVGNRDDNRLIRSGVSNSFGCCREETRSWGENRRKPNGSFIHLQPSWLFRYRRLGRASPHPMGSKTQPSRSPTHPQSHKKGGVKPGMHKRRGQPFPEMGFQGAKRMRQPGSTRI